MRSVLVTGSEGFIGTHLVNYLMNKDFVVYEADTASRYPRDITNSSATKTLIRDCFPDFIVHLAAVSHVSEVKADPMLAAETNILGTLSILEAVANLRRSDPAYNPRIIVAGTGEEYAVKSGTHYVNRTDQPLSPRTLYAATKTAAAMLIAAYRAEHNLNIGIARFANVYGPGQEEPNFIPLAINKLRRGDTITLHNNGNNAKEWVYVADIVRGIEAMMTHKGDGCFGGVLASVGSIAQAIKYELLHTSIRQVGQIETTEDGVCGGVVRMSPETAPEGWRLETDLYEGLRLTVAAALGR